MGYLEKIQNGSVSITKQGESVVITTRRFDPFTGEEVEPETATWSIEDHIDQAIADVHEQMKPYEDTLYLYEKVKEEFSK